MNSKCGVQSKRKCGSHESCVCIVGFPACMLPNIVQLSICVASYMLPNIVQLSICVARYMLPMIVQLRICVASYMLPKIVSV